MDCIFCKIINGEIPSYKVYEDEYVFAFLDIKPNCDGHTLVIPKKHVKDLDEIDTETLVHVMESAKKVKKILENKLNPRGIQLVQNNGEIQEVKHFHIHLKPYYKDSKISNVEDVYKKIEE